MENLMDISQLFDVVYVSKHISNMIISSYFEEYRKGMDPLFTTSNHLVMEQRGSKIHHEVLPAFLSSSCQEQNTHFQTKRSRDLSKSMEEILKFV